MGPLRFQLWRRPFRRAPDRLEKLYPGDSVQGVARSVKWERRTLVKMKWTVAKVFFAIAAVLFILAFLSVKVSDYNLITAGLAFVAAGLFVEGTM